MKIQNRSKCHFGLILLYSLIIVVFSFCEIEVPRNVQKTCQALNMLCPNISTLADRHEIEPGVRRSKCPLLASRALCKMS